MEPGWRSGRRSVNGLTLHVVQAGPADGPLLILLHGVPEFWWAWRRQISPLAEQGYHVVVPDTRGYNLSDAPQEIEAYRMQTLTADVLALADSFGADRFRLVGHDWGGVIAWDVAASHPGRIARLAVLDAPHPDTILSEVRRHPTQIVRSSYAAFFQLPRLPEILLGAADFWSMRTMMRLSSRNGAFRPGEMDRYVEAWSHPGALTAMLNYYRALRKRAMPNEPRPIRPRTLILWGERDHFLPGYIAQTALALCDDGELVTVPDATHWLHLENPGRVNAALIAFLGED